MIINWTNAFRTLRSAKVKEQQFRNSLIFDYISRQSRSANCSLCYEAIGAKDLLCEACFYKLHPPPIDFKISIVVEYAEAWRRIRDSRKLGDLAEARRLRLLGIPADCSLEKLVRRIFSLKPTRREEKIMLNNIKLKIRIKMANEWAVLKIKSMMNLIDEQLNIIRLKYLLCLKNLKIDDVLLLKKHMIEVRKYRSSLAEMLKNKPNTW
ncbi:hypothetical protein [Encephalitozoon cuniculi GB-M1]|uniref:Uncharacterized protein n=1 Tax=Encephalitozoon cuniculi (strain GB-M1) TaxID=284813 RepID=Q8STK6_ENCCU|nr:uncharacterized protein ECU09_1940 [Encephalitozoon cuniculi GB-M1]CAD27167.1 hypothetical protein [Encephalitozoon cuniculi GB-M1]